MHPTMHILIFRFICFVRYPFSATTVIKLKYRGFPGGSVVKNLLANAGDMGLTPDLGRFHMLCSN